MKQTPGPDVQPHKHHVNTTAERGTYLLFPKTEPSLSVLPKKGGKAYLPIVFGKERLYKDTVAYPCIWH